MFVEDARGNRRTAYVVRSDGVGYCSDCGKHMIVGSYYTRWTPYNPVSGKPGQMLVRCEYCYPFKEVERTVEDFDTPVRVPVYSAPQNTTGSVQPIEPENVYGYAKPEHGTRDSQGASSGDSWLNSAPPQKSGSGWTRETPSHISEVRTMSLGAVRVQTDPKLWAMLKEMVLHGKR